MPRNAGRRGPVLVREANDYSAPPLQRQSRSEKLPCFCAARTSPSRPALKSQPESRLPGQKGFVAQVLASGAKQAILLTARSCEQARFLLADTGKARSPEDILAPCHAPGQERLS